MYVTHKGKVYQTNVIATKNQTVEEVYPIAQEQVLKHWAN
ncbi:BA3454 family stress response protein [Neobacillus drentensis]